MSRIPTKLKVVLRDALDREIPWTGKTHRCRPAFVTDAEGNPNTYNRALAWGQGRRVCDPVRTVETVEVDNEPFRELILVGVETRSEGGKAWKVVTPQGWLVDLREDVFMPILFKRGVPKNRIIRGNFVWAINHTQMRLVQVGGEMYNKIKAAQASKENKDGTKAKRLAAKDLVVGGVYGSANTGACVYVGRVRHRNKLKFAWIYILYGYGYSRTSASAYQTMFNGEVRCGRTVYITGSYTYTEQLGKVDVPISDIQDRRTNFTDGYGCGLGDEDTVKWA